MKNEGLGLVKALSWEMGERFPMRSESKGELSHREKKKRGIKHQPWLSLRTRWSYHTHTQNPRVGGNLGIDTTGNRESCTSSMRTSTAKQHWEPSWLQKARNCSGTSHPGSETFLGNVWQPGTRSREGKWWYLPILGDWNGSSGARECENLIKWLTLVSRLVRQANEARRGADELRQ